MKVWLTHEDLLKLSYGLEHTRYAYGHDQRDTDTLIAKLEKARSQ